MNHPTVQPGHAFYWNTPLSEERMKKISDWILSLDKEEQYLLTDLVNDVRLDTQMNCICRDH